MKISDVIWLADVIEKLEYKHHLFTDELEDVFFHRPVFRKVQKGNIKGEDLYAALGRTAAGRYVIVFFILKNGKEALIISARDMDNKERQLYDRK